MTMRDLLPVNGRARGMITEYGLSSVPAQTPLKVRNEPIVARSKPTEEVPELVDEWVIQRPEAADDDTEMPEAVARPVAEGEDEGGCFASRQSVGTSRVAEEEMEVPAVERTHVEDEEPEVAQVPRREPDESVPMRPAAVMREKTAEPVADVEAVRRHAEDDSDEALEEDVARSHPAAIEPTLVFDLKPEPVASVRVEEEAVAIEPVQRSDEPQMASDGEFLSPIARASVVDDGLSGMPRAADTAISGIAGRMSGQERRKLQEIEAAVQRRRERDLQVEAGS